MKPGPKEKLIAANADYEAHYKAGIQALKGTDSKVVKAEDQHCLKGSMDIDNACKAEHSNSPRWDYLVVVQKRGDQTQYLAFIEIHGAGKGKNVNEVINKGEWLRNWIKQTGLHTFKNALLWVVTGRDSILPGSHYARALARNRIRKCGKVTPNLDGDVIYS